MTTLIEHIRKLNAETLAWVNEKPQHRVAYLITEDLDHWKEYDITTVEQFIKLAEVESDCARLKQIFYGDRCAA